MQMTGAQALIRSLEMEGTEVMFGLPGGAILPVYDPLLESTIRHILVRHEPGAGPMADGYAPAPDSPPLVVVTGQVPLSAIGSDAFQECDTTGITMPVTKHNWLIQSAADIPTVIREAFHGATTGRPGPVLVDIPKDISNQTMDWYWPEGVDLPGFRAPQPPDPDLAREAARLILGAPRPVIYAGGGILKARAAEALRRLADLTGIHVVTTLMARGAFPHHHPLALGMPGT